MGIMDSREVTAFASTSQGHGQVLGKRQSAKEHASDEPLRESFASFMDETTMEVTWPADDDGDHKAKRCELALHDYESLP